MRRALATALFLAALAACGGSEDEASESGTATSTTAAVTSAPSAPASTTAPPAPAAVSKPLPNVVGMDLQLAQDTLQAAGFYALKSHDAKGLNRNQVLDRNWTVVDQTPRAGATVPTSQVVDLGAVLDDEYSGAR